MNPWARIVALAEDVIQLVNGMTQSFMILRCSKKFTDWALSGSFLKGSSQRSCSNPMSHLNISHWPSLFALTLTVHGACVTRRSPIGLGVISAGACKAVKTVNLSVNLSQSSVSQLLTVILSSSHLVQVCAIERDCFAKSQREMSSCQVVESGSGNVW